MSLEVLLHCCIPSSQINPTSFLLLLIRKHLRGYQSVLRNKYRCRRLFWKTDTLCCVSEGNTNEELAQIALTSF